MATPEWINDLNALEIRRHRRLWYPFMKKYNCQFVCEIGVFQSQNFGRMMEHNPQVIVGVDAWTECGIPSKNDSGFTQEVLDEQYAHFLDLMKTRPSVQLCKQWSHEAVVNFPDEYFDLIYIDADHTYEGCKQDLEDWWPKVKSGMFFTGDDYSRYRAKHTGVVFGVVEAVNEFAKKVGEPIYEISQHGWAIRKP